METEPGPKISEQELLHVELPELRYKADMQLFEHGQNLSSEILKLSLAGIAVVGALLNIIPKAHPGFALDDGALRAFFSMSVAAFAACAGFALLQRFYASSGMFHHIKAMKLAMRGESGDISIKDDVEENLDIRLIKFLRAHFFLKMSAVLLVTGACLLGAAFVRFMLIL